MTVTANGGSDFEPIPADIYTARCFIVAGIGRQTTPYGEKDQCIIQWELVEYHRDFGQGLEPCHIAGFYPLSLGSAEKPSNLRKLLEGWRGRPFSHQEEAGFNLENILGSPCKLVIQHKQKQNGDITAVVVGAVKADPKMVPALKESPVFYDAWNHDERAFRLLPEWIQKKVVKMADYAEPSDPSPAPAGAAFDADADEIPF